MKDYLPDKEKLTEISRSFLLMVSINKLLYYKLIYTILYSNYYFLIINSPKVQTSQTSPKVHQLNPLT